MCVCDHPRYESNLPFMLLSDDAALGDGQFCGKLKECDLSAPATWSVCSMQSAEHEQD